MNKDSYVYEVNLNNRKIKLTKNITVPYYFYDWWWQDWHKNNIEPPEDNKNCWHDWKEYVGFTERYWYCEKCDVKSKEDPNIKWK